MFSQIVATRNTSHVWLQDVTLDASEDARSPLVRQDEGSFYSAVPVPVRTGDADGSVDGPTPPEEIEFLRATDPWIVTAAAVRCP